MSKKKTKFKKLHDIWSELKKGSVLSLKELIKSTGTSRSSIYRYIDELKAMGLPIGRNKEGWFLTYEPSEVSISLDLEEAFIVGYGVESLRDKTARAEGILERLGEGFSGLGSDQDRQEMRILLELKQALVENKVVAMEYFSTTTQKVESRRLEPQDMLLRDGHWFVQGHDQERGALRAFRVSQIQGLSITELPIQNANRSDKAVVHHWDADGTEATQVVLQVGGETAAWIKSQKLHPSMELKKVGSDSYQVFFKVNNPMNMVPWLMGLLNASIQEPLELAEAVVARAQNIAQSHGFMPNKNWLN